MIDTKIQWTDTTWNPVSGCTKVSPGCAHCYAEGIAERFRGPAYPKGFDITLREEKLYEPMRWKKPRRVFVNSMSDLFHEDIPEKFIRDIFTIMAQCSQHTFQVLTKRPERMYDLMMGWDWHSIFATLPMPNVWLGVSVENARFTHRIELLREIPSVVRFVSLEPLLGCMSQGFSLRGIDWAIIGGESGPKARPLPALDGMDPLDHIRTLIAIARRDGCDPFVKQLGTAWARSVGARDRKGGDPAEWPEDLRIREFPN